MVTRQTQKLIADKQKGLSHLHGELERAREKRDELNRELSNARRRLQRKRESTTFPQRVFNEVGREIRSENRLSHMLVAEIDRAIESGNEEFGRDEYKSALYAVTLDKDIYKFIPIGTGWNASVTVFIDFGEEAGDLNDWARGIDLYRDELRTRIDEDDDRLLGQRATEWWFENVYRGSLETKTVKKRLGYSGRKAPFWEILNSGSQPLASDRPDGSYNPVPANPTDFIGDAEAAIKLEFLSMFQTEKDIWFAEADALEEEIRTATEIRDSYTEDVRQISTELRLNERILRKFEEKAQYVDQDKLAEAIRKYRADERFETARINLTRRGTGRSVSISAKKLEGWLEEF